MADKLPLPADIDRRDWDTVHTNCIEATCKRTRPRKVCYQCDSGQRSNPGPNEQTIKCPIETKHEGMADTGYAFIYFPDTRWHNYREAI